MLVHPFLTRRVERGPHALVNLRLWTCWLMPDELVEKTKLLHSCLSSLPQYCGENNNLDQSSFPGSCLDIASCFVLCGCERRTLHFEQNEHPSRTDENEFAQGIGIVCL